MDTSPTHTPQPNRPDGNVTRLRFTSGQRDIFRQAFQKRADASLIKMTPITDRYNLKFTFDVFNLTNTASFDVPGNEVSQNEFFNSFPQAGTPVKDFYNAPSVWE